MRQIAYVGEDGEISVYDLDADQVIPVSRLAEGLEESGPDRLTNWPMWAPNGELLAYFRYDVANGEIRASTYSINTASLLKGFSSSFR